MFKTKLLIFLLTSILLGACVNKDIKTKNIYSINYIGGDVDGLFLSNSIKGYLNGLGMFNSNSSFQINASIAHETDVYVTNINNTSDRENISSILNASIIDNENDCIIEEYQDVENQFYVISSTINFMSNDKAVDKIKKTNTENLVRNLIQKLTYLELKC